MSAADPNKERLELALEAAGLDLWENNLLTGEVSRKACKTFAALGYTEEEAARDVQGIFGLVHPDDREQLQQAVERHLSGRSLQYRSEFRLRAKSGQWIWFANYGRVMDRTSTTPGQRLIGVTFNIDDRKRQEVEIAEINHQLTEQNLLLQRLNATLESLAAQDPLTGLANRRALMSLGEMECLRAERFGHPLSALIVDIDYFKGVNDTWGHLAGDKVICAVADACVGRTRRGVDIVARFGGEEFVLVLPETDAPSAQCVADSLRQTIAAQQVVVNAEGTVVSVTVSIGMATLEKGAHLAFEQLVNNADKALYRAKETGRNNVQHDTQA